MSSQHHAPHKFEVDNQVWLQAKQIKIHQQSAKLGPKQLGPFKVTEVLGDINYRLALPPALHPHDVFHIDYLSPYKGNKVNGLISPPSNPITIDGEEEYKVNYIRDSKMFGHTLKYLIHWKGYGEGKDTWEPAKNLTNSPQSLEEFHLQNPGSPCQINALLSVSLPWQQMFALTANADVIPSGGG